MRDAMTNDRKKGEEIRDARDADGKLERDARARA